MATEIYVTIEGFSNYAVSNFGNISNTQTGKHLKTSDCKGTLKVTLCENGKSKQFYVHRLVALAFVENPENKDFVIHVDDNRTNNTATNLKWITKREFDMIINNKMRQKREDIAMVRRVICEVKGRDIQR
jgi:hypothetical protein